MGRSIEVGLGARELVVFNEEECIKSGEGMGAGLVSYKEFCKWKFLLLASGLHV